MKRWKKNFTKIIIKKKEIGFWNDDVKIYFYTIVTGFCTRHLKGFFFFLFKKHSHAVTFNYNLNMSKKKKFLMFLKL